MQEVEILPSNLEELSTKLNQVLGKTAIQLVGTCSAVFNGRIKSELQPGPRLLLIKSDTSIILHGETGVKPLNWQKAYDGKIDFRYSTKGLEMYTYRPKTDETFTILFTKVNHAFSYSSQDNVSLQKQGDERDLVKYLVSNPSVIEEGLTIVSRELETLVGFIDIEAIDKNGKRLIIEVKKQRATPKDAFQLLRYIDTLEKQDKRCRGMLISAGTPLKVQEFLKQNSLEFFDVQWQELFPNLKRSKAKNLSDFL